MGNNVDDAALTTALHHSTHDAQTAYRIASPCLLCLWFSCLWTQHVAHRPDCILCSVSKTTQHVLALCNNHSLAADVVTKAFGPAWDRGEIPQSVLC